MFAPLSLSVHLPTGLDCLCPHFDIFYGLRLALLYGNILLLFTCSAIGEEEGGIRRETIDKQTTKKSQIACFDCAITHTHTHTFHLCPCHNKLIDDLQNIVRPENVHRRGQYLWSQEL